MIVVILQQNVITHSTSIAEPENGSVSNHVLNSINLLCRKVRFFQFIIDEFTQYHYYSEEPEEGIDERCYRANGFFDHEDENVCDK